MIFRLAVVGDGLISFFLAIQFKDTITLGGVILGLIVAGATLIGILYGSKWKTTAEVNRANAEAWESTASRFEDENQHLKLQLDEAKIRITRLESRPDLTGVLAQITQMQIEIAAGLKDHDTAAERRADRLVTAILEGK